MLAFQAEGLLRTRRGSLVIFDRAGLAAQSCESHAALHRRIPELLPEAVPGSAASSQPRRGCLSSA